ncbi:MAG: hypothetical protein JSV60_06535 [Desulfobacterales bacterium]|nr:MAG: hypothetical protein JSV60_06535 [Desulfobacterales bacterium]
MSQLIVCQNAHGIILAADSKAVALDLSGKATHLTVDRMLQLGAHTAILTGGAAEGMAMITKLKNFLAEEDLDDVQDIYKATLPFLATRFEAFMRKLCEVIPLDPIHHLYFILGGYTARDPERPFRLYLLWTKKKLPQLDGDEIPLVYSAPRLMGLEYKLNKLCQENTPLEHVLPEVKKGMEGRAGEDEEVGPPFRFAFITEEGFREV